jgi:hypothetical protein
MVVMTWHPNITAAIPPVIASDPYKSRARWRAWMLDYGGRWTDMHIHLRKRSHRKQSESKQSCEDNLLHSQKLLQR